MPADPEESELERLHYYIRQVPGVLWTTDRELRYTSTMGAMLGGLDLAPKRALGLSLAEHFKSADPEFPPLKAHRRALAGESVDYEFEWRGRSFHAHLEPLREPGGGIVGVIGAAQDVTERRRLESAVLQSEKLAAMGQMAAGLAHEIKKPLVVILGYVELAMQGVPQGSPFEMPLQTIRRQAMRCHKLAQNLLAFSHHDRPAPVEFELRETVQNAVSLVENRLGARIVIRYDLGTDPILMRGHPEQIEQVVINLAGNAIDAMPDGGTLTLRARQIDTSRGGEALLEVTDTGAGIPKEIQDRLFEAFFTTKAPGKGTGLGLWLLREIVMKHGGTIELASEPGHGTTFSVTLPLSGPPA
jgi:two-component system cell cycle sensor histidine kinase/response regulator CckA